jgi:predicted kinase
MPGDWKPPGGGLFVLVAGWPGSGKSTLAAALAPELGLPLLAKDEIKEALMDALGTRPRWRTPSGWAGPQCSRCCGRPGVARGRCGQHLV